jgi:hypothetical protein
MDDDEDCIYCTIESLLTASVSRASLAQEMKRGVGEEHTVFEILVAAREIASILHY